MYEAEPGEVPAAGSWFFSPREQCNALTLRDKSRRVSRDRSDHHNHGGTL